jgi:hypothetical protein
MIAASTWIAIDDGSQINDVRLRSLLDHWRSAALPGRIPSKDMVDPVRLGDLMGWLFLYRIEPDPLRFLYLRCGPKMVRRVGFDMTGKYVDQHPDPKVRDGILANFTAVVTTRKPHYRRVPRRVLDHDMVTEALVLPLADADGTINHLLGLQILDFPGGASS